MPSVPESPLPSQASAGVQPPVSDWTFTDKEATAILTTPEGRFKVTVDITQPVDVAATTAKLNDLAKEVFTKAIEAFWNAGSTKRLELVMSKDQPQFLETRDGVSGEDTKPVEKWDQGKVQTPSGFSGAYIPRQIVAAGLVKRFIAIIGFGRPTPQPLAAVPQAPLATPSGIATPTGSPVQTPSPKGQTGMIHPRPIQEPQPSLAPSHDPRLSAKISRAEDRGEDSSAATPAERLPVPPSDKPAPPVLSSMIQIRAVDLPKQTVRESLAAHVNGVLTTPLSLPTPSPSPRDLLLSPSPGTVQASSPQRQAQPDATSLHSPQSFVSHDHQLDADHPLEVAVLPDQGRIAKQDDLLRQMDTPPSLKDLRDKAIGGEPDPKAMYDFGYALISGQNGSTKVPQEDRVRLGYYYLVEAEKKGDWQAKDLLSEHAKSGDIVYVDYNHDEPALAIRDRPQVFSGSMSKAAIQKRIVDEEIFHPGVSQAYTEMRLHLNESGKGLVIGTGSKRVKVDPSDPILTHPPTPQELEAKRKEIKEGHKQIIAGLKSAIQKLKGPAKNSPTAKAQLGHCELTLKQMEGGIMMRGKMPAKIPQINPVRAYAYFLANQAALRNLKPDQLLELSNLCNSLIKLADNQDKILKAKTPQDAVTTNAMQATKLPGPSVPPGDVSKRFGPDTYKVPFYPSFLDQSYFGETPRADFASPASPVKGKEQLGRLLGLGTLSMPDGADPARVCERANELRQQMAMIIQLPPGPLQSALAHKINLDLRKELAQERKEAVGFLSDLRKQAREAVPQKFRRSNDDMVLRCGELQKKIKEKTITFPELSEYPYILRFAMYDDAIRRIKYNNSGSPFEEYARMLIISRDRNEDLPDDHTDKVNFSAEEAQLENYIQDLQFISHAADRALAPMHSEFEDLMTSVSFNTVVPAILEIGLGVAGIISV